MAQQGYWIVCEDVYAGDKHDQEPTLCMGHVDGFSYAEAMAGTRMEVLSAVRRKLQDNIRFLLDCYNDIPEPSNSDQPPQKNGQGNATYLFLGLKEIGIPYNMLMPLAA